MVNLSKFSKGLIPLFLSILLFFSLTILVLADSSSEKGRDIEEIKAEILANNDKYLTVGKENCEFLTITEALKAVDSNRNVIYIMDKVHTEASIIITKDLDVTIKGFGPLETIIQGASEVALAEDRVFLIKPEGKLKIEDLTVRHGRVNYVPRGGGGILNRGTVIINNCIIRDNMATYGVGIYTEGYFEMNNSMVIGNRYIKRPAEETRLGTGCWGSGGGIKIENGEATITNSSFIDNTCFRSGGGVKISCPAVATLINCTIAENKTVHLGGGVGIQGEAVLIHCTIVRNESQSTGGIFLSGDVEMFANIIAENARGDFTVLINDKFVGEVHKNEYNLIGDGEYESFLSGNPQLVKIDNKDGTPIKYALKAESSAVDAISTNVSFAETDQRGIARNDGKVDIGAYEFNGNKLLQKDFFILLIAIIALVVIILYSVKKMKNKGV